MHRGANNTDGPSAAEETKDEKEKSDEKKKEDAPMWKALLKSIVLLTVGVGVVTVFSDPMVGVLSALADKDNKYVHPFIGGSRHGQYLPIPAFYLSFVITPLCSNASELVASLVFAAKKTKETSSMTFSQLYGAATMNNTLGLGIFAALVYFRDLQWYYSAEVTVIILVEAAIGILVIIVGFAFKHTYFLFLGFVVGVFYFLAIGVTALLENLFGWK